VLVLGIETSCDDTSAAVVRDGSEVLSNVVSSQDRFHAAFAGVVPEIASRRHLETIHQVVAAALQEAGAAPAAIDRIAVTNRPGLIGSLLVGLAAAKGFALAWDKPLVPVNHLAAHLYAPGLTAALAYPLGGLIVSGGHTLLVVAESPTALEIVGSTIDDAVGEVYDKIAKHLSLGYPGGPLIDRLAAAGDRTAYAFPRTLLDETERHFFNFSFSGIKTAVVYQQERFHRAGAGGRTEDLAASFQEAVVDVLEEKTARLVRARSLTLVAVSGGVAANARLRERFEAITAFKAVFPERRYCTDNAAMVAGLAFHADEVLTGEALLGLEVEARIVQRGRGTVTAGS
jgi:N6-L-threonylcarbamoyladenine synthase